MFREFVAVISVKCEEIGNCANKTKTLDMALTNVAQIIIGLIGGLSIIFLLWGGFRYVISRGDPAQIKTAKETVLYAIVGLVVAIMAYAIVAFVATEFG